MPKLLALVACEKVIIDRNNLPSLIGIFQRMNIQLQDAPLPDNAVGPARWAVFSLWQHVPDERGVEFTQHTEIIAPGGGKFAETTTKFKSPQDDTLQSESHVDVGGVPINKEGVLTVRVWLEGIADSMGEYQFLIKHVPKGKDG